MQTYNGKTPTGTEFVDCYGADDEYLSPRLDNMLVYYADTFGYFVDVESGAMLEYPELFNNDKSLFLARA